MNTLAQTNWRARVALYMVRLDRNPATMAELYDGLNQRRRMRLAKLTPDEEREYNRRYLLQHAPDLLR